MPGVQPLEDKHMITAMLLNVVAWKALEKVMAGRAATDKGTPAMPKAA